MVQLIIANCVLLFLVLACVGTRADIDQLSSHCSFPSYLQDMETTDPGRQRKSWISRTLYAGVTDSWTRRTVVTINGGLMRIEHLLHASCRLDYSREFSRDFRRRKSFDMKFRIKNVFKPNTAVSLKCCKVKSSKSQCASILLFMRYTINDAVFCFTLVVDVLYTVS